MPYLTYLYYGIREGDLLHISQVPRGLSCECVCPACHKSLVAKKGRQREHHFAHASGNSCQHAIETALHLAAKDVLARRREIVLPAVEIRFPYDKFVNYDFSTKVVTIAPEQRYQLDSVELEHRVSEIIPDVLAKVKNRSLLIEIRVTHKIDERKLKKIQDLNMSCIEIDLSNMPRNFSKEDIEMWIVDAGPHKRWIHNVAIERRRKHMLSQAISRLLFTHERILSTELVYNCPLTEYAKPYWTNGKRYAAFMYECAYCEHLLEKDYEKGSVICDA